MTARDLPPDLQREAAFERRRRAKELVTKAACALVDQHPTAAALGDAALVELREADAELAHLDAEDEERRS